jgi:hypothetical protein
MYHRRTRDGTLIGTQCCAMQSPESNLRPPRVYEDLRVFKQPQHNLESCWTASVPWKADRTCMPFLANTSISVSFCRSFNLVWLAVPLSAFAFHVIASSRRKSPLVHTVLLTILSPIHHHSDEAGETVIGRIVVSLSPLRTAVTLPPTRALEQTTLPRRCYQTRVGLKLLSSA